MVRALRSIVARLRFACAWRRAVEARGVALQALREAKQRGDTRGQHEAYARIRAATHAALRLEVHR